MIEKAQCIICDAFEAETIISVQNQHNLQLGYVLLHQALRIPTSSSLIDHP